MSIRHHFPLSPPRARSRVVAALVLAIAVLGPVDAGAAADATIRVRQVDAAGAAVPGGCWRASGSTAVVERCDIDDGATDAVIVLDGLAAGEHQLRQTVAPVGHRSAPDRTAIVGAGQVLDVTTSHVRLPTLTISTTASGAPIGGSCWVLRPADQTEGGVELCDDGDGSIDGTASTRVDTTGEHVLFHTRAPSGYLLLDSSTVTVGDDDVALSFELRTPPPPSVPTNVVAPTVTGAARVGSRLAVQAGTWTGDPSLSFQWQRCLDGPNGCLDLPGQTGATYLVQLADGDRSLRTVVTATNSAGSSSVTTEPTAPIDDAPVNGSPPSISGRTIVGSTLSANSGTWLSYYGAPAIGFDWQRCDGAGCRSIGVRTSTHTLTEGDLGARMRVVITATDLGGASTATSQLTGTVVTTGPRSVDPPTVSGAAFLGETWTATPGIWSGEGRLSISSYQWQRCSPSCAAIPGATSRTYKTTKADGGQRLRVVVTATDSTGRTSAASDTSGPIQVRTPVVVAPPTMSGTAAIGQRLTLDRGTWYSPVGGLSYRYSWMRCSDPAPFHCDPIEGATGTSYTVTRADVGSWLRARVDVTNRDGTTPAVTSLSTQVVLRRPVNVSAPTIAGEPRNGYELVGSPGEWTSAAGPMRYRYQWERCVGVPVRCETIVGATRSTYVVTPADERWSLRLVVQARNDDADAVAFSDLTGVVVLHRPVMVTEPRLVGTPKVGQEVRVDPGTWTSAAGPLRYRYQWARVQPDSDQVTYIAGAKSATYRPTSADVGFRLRVFVQVDNDDGWDRRPSDISAVVRR